MRPERPRAGVDFWGRHRVSSVPARGSVSSLAGSVALRKFPLVSTSCVTAGCGRHGMAPPACKNPTSFAFIAGRGSWYSACSIGVPVLKSLSLPFVRYDTLLVSAVIELDLLTLKLVRIVRGIRNRLTNFDVSGTFRSIWTTCQTHHVTSRP